MNEVCHAQTQEEAGSPSRPLCLQHWGRWDIGSGHSSDQSCGQQLVSRWLARCTPSRLWSGPETNSLNLFSLGWEAVPCMCLG